MQNEKLHKIADIILGIKRGRYDFDYCAYSFETTPIDATIKVFAVDPDTGQSYELDISDDGSYHLLAGSYRYEATLDGYYASVGTFTVTEEMYSSYKVVAVVLQREVTGEVIVTGIVKDAVTKNNLSNVSVICKTYTGTSYSNYVGQATTSSEGTYEIYVPYNRSCIIEVYKSGYLAMSYYFKVEEEDTKSLDTIMLVPGAPGASDGLTGKAINIMSGYGISDMTVYISSNNSWGAQDCENNQVEWQETTLTTNYEGVFIVDPGSAWRKGDFTLKFEKNNYLPAYLNVYTTEVEQTGDFVVLVSPDSIIEIDGMQAVLTWGADPSDLDSHIKGYQNGNNIFHVYYSNKDYTVDGTTYVNLDVDDTSGYGPETTTIYYTTSGCKYIYYIYKFSGNGSIAGNSNAVVKIFDHGELIQTIECPKDSTNTDRYWSVFTYDADTKRVYIINQLSSTEPTLGGN